jgi:hypothetical protein
MSRIDQMASITEIISDRSAALQNGCRIWKLTFRGRTEWVHRLVYEASRGSISGGLVIDHLCRNRACVEPSHLEAVTRKENIQRGLRGRLIVACPVGHSYSTDNTLTDRGARRCRTCHANKERNRRLRRKEASRAETN